MPVRQSLYSFKCIVVYAQIDPVRKVNRALSPSAFRRIIARRFIGRVIGHASILEIALSISIKFS